MKKRTIIAAVIIMAALASTTTTAHADTTGDTSVTTKTDGGQLVIGDQRGACYWYGRTVTRRGLEHRKLWAFSMRFDWCASGGKITSYHRTLGSSGTMTWQNDGMAGSWRWGGNGSYRVGSKVKWHFESTIRAPFATENNYPWISETAYPDGHATSTWSCGC